MRNLQVLVRTEYAKQLVYGPDDPRTIPYLEASIRKFPRSAQIRLLMAEACRVSRPDRVAPEAKIAADLAPTDLTLQVYAGWLLAHHGDVGAARNCVTRVRELAGDDYAPITDLVRLEGIVLAHERHFAAAEEKLRWAVATEPENTKNAHVLAAFLWATGRNEDAVGAIDEAMWSANGGVQRLLDLRAAITAE